MKKRILYVVVMTALGLNLFWGAHLYYGSAQAADKNAVYDNLELFTRVLERVRDDYVDGDKTSYQDLIYGALHGMISTLDPHSEFMEPVKFNELKSDTEGAFGGVGIQIGLRDGFLTVITPMDDTPAFNAGILTGDRLVKIEGKSTEKLPMQDVVKKLRGEPGTEVTITTFRPSSGVTKDYALKRAIIKVDTVKDINGKRDFPVDDNKIGYIRLTQFNEPTSVELEAALKKLQAHGMRGLVLDLRNNPGGLLDQAVKVCEFFLPSGELVVTTEGRMAPRKSEYRARSNGNYMNVPMVTIVNGGSASASEIVAGCLQDVKPQRAIIVGEQSFGKGSVQSILPMPDGSALRLTTAKYYTPSHRVIHERGIKPDIEIPISPEDEEALIIKRLPGGVDAYEGFDDKRRAAVRELRDVQLDRAVDLLKGILVYSERSGGMTKKVASK
jgi:carboxyl-terminal processing protease